MLQMDFINFNRKLEQEPLLKRVGSVNDDSDTEASLDNKLRRFRDGLEADPLLKSWISSYSEQLHKAPYQYDSFSGSQDVEYFLNNDLRQQPVLRSYNAELDKETLAATELNPRNVEYFQEDDWSWMKSGSGKNKPLKNCICTCNVELENEPLLQISQQTTQKRRVSTLEVPPDKYYLAHLVAFFTGVISLLPLTFFLVANDYWMYKFRDISFKKYDLNKKTYFQTMFISMTSLCTALPTIISVFLVAKFGDRLETRKTYVVCLGFGSSMFIIFTVLTQVNTDPWQTAFFLSSLVVIGAIAFIQPFLTITTVVFLSKCPSKYLKFNLYGSATGSLFGSTLQIISLSVGKSSTQTAFIYFISGTVMMVFTFSLTYMMKYSPVINFYLKIMEQEHSKTTHTLNDYWEISKKMWYLILMLVVMLSGLGIGHPNITNLVVSEGYTGTGTSLWHDKYFVVTATYFLFDFFQLVGRFLGRAVITEKTCIWFVLITIIRSYGLGILIWFCNAQPRSHLPVLFPHDYQYMIILVVYSLSASALMTSIMLSIPPIAQEKTELAYVLIIGIMTLAMTAGSPLNPLYIKLL